MQLFMRRQCLLLEPFAYSTGPDFAKYMPEFYKYLEMGLQNFEDYRVCVVTVAVNSLCPTHYPVPLSHLYEERYPAIQQVHLPQQSSCGDRDVLIVFQMARTLALRVAVEAVPPTQLLQTLQVQVPTHHVLLQLHN
nr:importin subunit beta-1 [Tanacetum cinerariifolium]